MFGKALVEVLESPVDRYAPSLSAGCSVRVTLEDGERDALLTPQPSQDPKHKTHAAGRTYLFQPLGERETHDSGTNYQDVKRSSWFRHEAR